jgi:hypothetical protein
MCNNSNNNIKFKNKVDTLFFILSLLFFENVKKGKDITKIIIIISFYFLYI